MLGQVVISGLLAGALYAMVALGLGLIFGVMRVLNVSHGPLLMLGAYTTFWLFQWLRKRRLGKAVPAVSQSREVAQVCGIDVGRIHMLAFGIGSALAAAGGSLVAVMVAIQPEMGQVYTFKSFLVIVLGGAGNYPGALLGGLLLGLIEQLSSLFLTTQVNEAVAYVLLVLVLRVRPTGLLKGRAS